jgi:DMSO/TMAO reductase YedYZ molybdopterin-dependent catalytic subunit
MKVKHPKTLSTQADLGGHHRLAGAVLGVLSGAAAIGASQIAAAIVGGTSSPVIAVGSTAIDATPEWLKSFAIRTFGSKDKLALLVGIGVVLVIAAALLGIASIRRPRVGAIGLVVFGAVGVLASVTRPSAGLVDAVPAIVGAGVGLLAFRYLRTATGLPDPSRLAAPEAEPDQKKREPVPQLDRRRFLRAGVVIAAAAAVSGAVGQYLVRRMSASASRAAVRMPHPFSSASPVPSGADLHIPELSSFITPNDRFYRVDTALIVPAVDTDGWQLRIHGMVEHEMTLDYDQLTARPTIERDVTLCCVSNEVGGEYVGNARWVGVPLAPLLEEAGVLPGADQLVSRSSDGWTAGTPTAAVMDGRDAILAVSMNGEPLPLEHGFPVRMVIPGLYGYVSATKWLVDLELTTFDAFDPYWIERGWSKQAPIKTQSRIDTPRASAKLQPGEVVVAGVAWAQHRGIEGVEVSVDEGPWMPAELGAEDTIDTWRQWMYRWSATGGDHRLSVRATDGTGETQPSEEVAPFPNGATGNHTIVVRVG